MTVKSKFLKSTGLGLAIMFSQLAMSGSAMAGEDNDITGTWENDSIGVVEIRSCDDDKSKFCGYLLETTPEAMEEFQLRVENTSDNIRGMVVMSGLKADSDGSKFTDGSFENTNSSQAQSAELSISYAGDVMNVRASVGWFGEDFEFQRIDQPSQTVASLAVPTAKAPKAKV